MTIKILGSGCSNCQRLEANTRTALADLSMNAEIEKVQDMPTIMRYGVMSTPALVVDEEVKSSGRALSPKEIAGLIQS